MRSAPRTTFSTEWCTPIPAMRAGSTICRCPTSRSGTCSRRRAIWPEALKWFRDGFAIAERLAQSDPGNVGWQFDLGISSDRVGDVQTAQGDLAAALKSYQAKPNITSPLAQTNPTDAHCPHDLSVSSRLTPS